MNRRSFLRGGGAAAAAALLAGCGDQGEQTTTPGRTTEGGPPRRTTTRPVEETTTERDQTTRTTTPRPLEQRFDRVVDMGDAAVDAAGGAAINDALDERAGDDTVLVFPEGRYLMADSWTVRDFSNFGVVGRNATVVPPDGYSGYLFAAGGGGTATDFLFEGVTFDFTAENTGGRPLQARVDDGLVVRDVTVRGVQDTGQDLMRFDVTARDGTGLVQNMRLPDGGTVETPVTGCLVGPTSVGEISFVNCRIADFPDNGLYASPAKGPVHVRGGFYANNGIANVRVGDRATVRDVHVRCDRARPGVENMRGIRIRQGADVLVEDSTVELLEVTFSDGAITVAPWVESATIRDVTVRIETDDIPALRVKPPAAGVRPGGDAPHVTVENARITGGAAGAAAVEVADRDGCAFDGLCVRQTGANRDGVYLLRSADSAVRNAAIDVTGEPLVFQRSNPVTSNVRTEFADGPSPAGGPGGCR